MNDSPNFFSIGFEYLPSYTDVQFQEEISVNLLHFHYIHFQSRNFTLPKIAISPDLFSELLSDNKSMYVCFFKTNNR